MSEQTEQKAERPGWATIAGVSTLLLAGGIFCMGFGPHMHQNVVALGMLLVPLAGIGLSIAATIYLLGRR